MLTENVTVGDVLRHTENVPLMAHRISCMIHGTLGDEALKANPSLKQQKPPDWDYHSEACLAWHSKLREAVEALPASLIIQYRMHDKAKAKDVGPKTMAVLMNALKKAGYQPVTTYAEELKERLRVLSREVHAISKIIDRMNLENTLE
jgi:hypothetical protein